MKEDTILVTLLFLVFLSRPSIAQDNLKEMEAMDTKKNTHIVNIESLDGKKEKIIIIPDYVNKILRMGCLKDTINMDHFWGVAPDIKILNKNFVEIDYEIRGGSNLALGNTLILCVYNHHLNEALHVLRYSDWESFDKLSYLVKLFLVGHNKKDFRLKVNVYDTAVSGKNPKTNYNYHDQTVLNFDTINNVFCSAREEIYDQYVAGKSKKGSNSKIMGNFPVVLLGKQTYYFLKKRWYQRGTDNAMHEVE